MNWALAILTIYAVGVALLFVLLVIDEACRRKRVSCGGTVDAWFCALLWPVILGIILYERIGVWRRMWRSGQRFNGQPLAPTDVSPDTPPARPRR